MRNRAVEGRVYNFLLQTWPVMPGRLRTIVAVSSDLFLQSRITELAASLGVTARFVSDSEGLKRTLEADAFLVVLDLSSTEYEPFIIIQLVKTSWPSLRILGFFPHVKYELKTRAEKAGVDVVVPNSKFMETLKEMLAAEV